MFTNDPAWSALLRQFLKINAESLKHGLRFIISDNLPEAADTVTL